MNTSLFLFTPRFWYKTKKSVFCEYRISSYRNALCLKTSKAKTYLNSNKFCVDSEKTSVKVFFAFQNASPGPYKLDFVLQI